MTAAGRAAAWVAATILLAVSLGCGATGPESARTVFADASAPIWSDARLETEIELGAWHPLEAPESWTVSGARFERTQLGLVLGVEQQGQTPASLVAEVDLDASRVEILELQVEAAPPLGRVELRWTAALPSDGGGRRVQGRVQLDLSLFMADRLRSQVADHPQWRGRIERLEWRFSRIPDGQRLLVRGLRAFESESNPQALAEAVSSSWRVDLDRDVRPALLTLPGLERRLSFRVPPQGGAFRAALGATAPRGETVFVLRLRDREKVAELGRHVLSGRQLAAWSPVTADLAPWRGREVTLELLVEGPAWKPGEGLPAWGGPELVQLDLAQSNLAQPNLAQPNKDPAVDPRPDLVLISADTLRADHLSLYGYSRQTSPALDAWARQNAVVFKRAVAPSPWTLPSHVSMLSGLDPLSHGVNIGLPTPPRLELLAETLRASGYATFADTGGGYLHPSYGLGQGFDVFRYPPSQVPGEKDLAAAVERAMAFAEQQPGPVLLFLHSYETHEPYTFRPGGAWRAGGAESPNGASETTWITEWVPPRAEEGYAHRRRFIDVRGGEPVTDHRPVIDAYDSRVANLDAQLAPLFAWLERRKDANRPSAALFTSDHGESLGEDGRGGHASLERQLLHIPMVLSLPDGRDAGREIDARVRLYDVMPTLLELAGVSVPGGLDGESLLDQLRAPASRQAWAASPSTNAGVAYDDSQLHGDELLRFRLQPAAWAPGGLARFEDLGEALLDPSAGAPPGSPSDSAALRQVLRRLEASASGLELLVVNGGEGPLTLELAGSAVQNHRVKSLDAAERALEWRGQVAGALLELEAGKRRRLLLQTPRRGDLAIRLVDGHGDRRLHLDLATETLPLVLEPTADGWRRSRDGAPPRSGLRLRWLGEAEQADGATAVDAELQKQLRALGYTG